MKRPVYLITLLIMLISFMPAAHGQEEPLRMHPLLRQIAMSRSDEMVRVIVQQEPEQAVVLPVQARASVAIMQDLPLINGFVTEVPASSLEALAQTPGVRWISPDAEVRSTGIPGSFGPDGVVSTNIGQSAAAYATTIQADGKIVTAGTTWNGSNDDATVSRYNTDGSLDRTFGQGGTVVTAVGSAADRVMAAGIQSDGKILVGGHSFRGSNYDFMLIRYLSDGRLDPSFGSGGKVTTSITGYDYIKGLQIQPDGKIIAIGASNGLRLALVRYHSNGSLDSSFHGDGKLVTNVLSGNAYGVPLALQSDGKLVVVGTRDLGWNRWFDVVVARYHSNGNLDTSFDGDGYSEIYLSRHADRGNAVAIQPDGKILVTGIGYNGNDFDVALLRLQSNGRLDTTFDGDGIALTQLGGDDYGHAIELQSDGKIVIAGVSYQWNGSGWDNSVVLLRYLANGSLDSTFDGDGFAQTQVKNSNNYGYSMTRQADGKVIVAGYVDTGNSYSFTTLRYRDDGALDMAVTPVIPAIRAEQLQQQAPHLTGKGITVAIVDSGISSHPDLNVAGSNTSRIKGNVNFSQTNNSSDGYGHGTHVAGIIAGNGTVSGGLYVGVAPEANLLNIKVSNQNGVAYISDVINSLYWIYQNRNTYNIRVVNLSMNSIIAEPYHRSPLSAATEILWFNGITVVVAAGNNGTDSGPVTLFPPANDPFVITVGAADTVGTGAIGDDQVPFFSAYGLTEDGHAKPDLVAPGRHIVSLLPTTGATVYTNYPPHRVNNQHFRMSGTSMAAPVVSGAIAVLLQDEPHLTPDQIKYRLKATANKSWSGYSAAKAGAGYLDLYAAVNGTTTQSSNTGLPVSMMLYTGTNTPAWNSVSWNSVSWNSVSWNSVSWNSVSWNSTTWTSDVRSSSLWENSEAPEIPLASRPDDSGLLSDGTMGMMASTGVRTDEVLPDKATGEEQINLLYLPFINR